MKCGICGGDHEYNLFACVRALAERVAKLEAASEGHSDTCLGGFGSDRCGAKHEPTAPAIPDGFALAPGWLATGMGYCDIDASHRGSDSLAKGPIIHDDGRGRCVPCAIKTGALVPAEPSGTPCIDMARLDSLANEGRELGREVQRRAARMTAPAPQPAAPAGFKEGKCDFDGCAGMAIDVPEDQRLGDVDYHECADHLRLQAERHEAIARRLRMVLALKPRTEPLPAEPPSEAGPCCGRCGYSECSEDLGHDYRNPPAPSEPNKAPLSRFDVCAYGRREGLFHCSEPHEVLGVSHDYRCDELRKVVADLEARLADLSGWRDQCACHERTIERLITKLAGGEQAIYDEVKAAILNGDARVEVERARVNYWWTAWFQHGTVTLKQRDEAIASGAPAPTVK